MTRGTNRPVPVLLLEFSEAVFVTLTEGIASFGRVGQGAVDRSLAMFDLDRYVGVQEMTIADIRPYCLQVESEPQGVAFRTAAELRLVQMEDSAFFRLPWVVARAGCSAWVRGVVVMEAAAYPPSSTKRRPLAIWIDLPELVQFLRQDAARISAV